MKLPARVIATASLVIVGCGDAESDGDHAHGPDTHTQAPEHPTGGQSHTHADGTVHEPHNEHPHGTGHAHDEVAIDPAQIGEMTVELAQGHGPLVAGHEGHLVVTLPYNDGGQTTVRAWIGSRDRTLSMVGLGVYAPSHDDYDIHAMTPDPLPADAMWWIEIQKPDGTKVVGSARPLVDED